jgi:ketosteroid isomerase-like protein
VTQSPLEELLTALDRLDADGAVALLAPDVRMLMVDGRRAHGTDQAREVLASFMAQLRSTGHQVTAQWHLDDTWIAEVESTYELRDYLQLKLPRAFVLRANTTGIFEMHVYGAHEQALAEHRTGEEGLWIGGRWIPPL